VVIVVAIAKERKKKRKKEKKKARKKEIHSSALFLRCYFLVGRRLPCIKIIIDQVEDLSSVRMLGQRMLTRAGAQCSTAADGELAVAAVHASVHERRPFHVVLMDFHMPNMDGLQAME
jgi:PleD family two-component response regulator